jgi:hypothetical protein
MKESIRESSCVVFLINPILWVFPQLLVECVILLPNRDEIERFHLLCALESVTIPTSSAIVLWALHRIIALVSGRNWSLQNDQFRAIFTALDAWDMSPSSKNTTSLVLGSSAWADG